MNFTDQQQQAMSFLVQQAAHIESTVNEVLYPDIQYPALIPVDTSANEWAKTITFFSTDKLGAAEWFNHEANDVPRADVTKAKHDHSVHMAAIGYGYTLEELGEALLIPGTNLTADRAMAARRAAEEFIDDLVFVGDTAKGMDPFVNYTGITSEVAPSDGTGSSTAWADKTPAQVLRDVNSLLTSLYTGSNTTLIADTLLLPIEAYTLLTTVQLPNTTMNLYTFIMQNNVYTAMTGQALTIRAVRRLSTVGTGGTGRAIAYVRNPMYVKLHLPMPHRFLPVWQTGPIRFDVPGIFRTGGVEIRQPGSVRYLDGVTVPASS